MDAGLTLKHLHVPGEQQRHKKGRTKADGHQERGENRLQKGMDANSILFMIMLTDQINDRSFFEHMTLLYDGDW